MKLRFLFLVFSFCLLFSSCSIGSKRSSGSQITLYFTKADPELGVALIPVHRKIPKGKTAYEVALKELFLGPNLEEQKNFNLKTEIPEGTRLISIKEDPKSVDLNISSQFLSGGGSETMQVRFRQLRETVLSLAKGRPVYLYIDGQKAKTIGGEGLEVPQPLGDDVE